MFDRIKEKRGSSGVMVGKKPPQPQKSLFSISKSGYPSKKAPCIITYKGLFGYLFFSSFIIIR